MDTWSFCPSSFPYPHLDIPFVATMHPRLVMAQAMIQAVSTGLALDEVVNLNLVCYSILVTLGPQPMLSSVLEAYRCSAACVTFCTGLTLPIQLPTTTDVLTFPPHPARDVPVRPFTALRYHVWIPWMIQARPLARAPQHWTTCKRRPPICFKRRASQLSSSS